MITIDGNSLSIRNVEKIAFSQERVTVSPSTISAINNAHSFVMELANSGKPIYGVNTGFGIFSNKNISREQSIELNKNLIYSHAVATGPPLSIPIVRAAMAIRMNTLAKGVSGVQYEIIHALMQMLNMGVTPLVSSKGSLGSSGDLCLLAQIGLVILGEEDREAADSGYAYLNGSLMSGKQALNTVGIKPVQFSQKDGLALINGATFSAAITTLAIKASRDLSKLADISVGLSLESLRGNSTAFHAGIHALRNMEGQQCSAETIRSMIAGSNLVDNSGNLQDAYSLRCAPQVHGCVRDTIKHVEDIITREINAATDNPLMVEDGEFISGGNFHGEPIGMAADFLSIAMTELGAISERRIFRLMDENLNNGLPAMLVDSENNAGLNSGLMILQYTAAALVLENQTLASPDSIRSLPTSANQEDHNANSYNAAHNLYQIIQNTTKIIAIELFCARQAISIRISNDPKFVLGVGTEKVYQIFQAAFAFQKQDVQWRKDLEELYALMIGQTPFKDEILSVVN